METKGTKVTFDCEICGKSVTKWWYAYMGERPRFCSKACKGEMQRRSKPVDREWLYQKYVVEGLDCTQIAALVQRNSKRVWEWLRDYGIPTRGRGTTGNGRHTKGIKPNITPEGRERKSAALRAARLADGRVPYLRKDGTHAMRGRRGADTPNWKGGITPERTAVYGSLEWKAAVKAVWRRDNATCQRCRKHHNTATNRGTFDIHHIVSFAVAELRCEVNNLVLLCEECHYWVHSADNVNRDFIREA
jgi:5-methylcytosine-specific restriction endonuclease McrA